MPKFKRIKVSARSQGLGELNAIDVDINISADGVFYAQAPEFLLIGLDDTVSYDPSKSLPGKIKVSASTFDALERCLSKALLTVCKPDVTTEHVIRYNIESHTTFAADGDGNIFPNAGFPGAEWGRGSGGQMYGNHFAQNPNNGGYSLTIGARAMTKTTTRYGDKSKVSYENYYQGGNHLGHDNPAQLLNSWCAFSLPGDAKEIPYSDEAALFFHSLLMGISTLSQRIQESTFDTANLLRLIATNGNPMLPAPKQTDVSA